MSRPAKTIVFWILIPLLLSLVLFTLLFVYATEIINQEPVKNRIETAVSMRLGGRFSYARAVVSLLPRPRITIQDPNISIPEKFSGTMKNLDIYPELRRLITGKIWITIVQLNRPDMHVALAGKAGNQAAQENQAESSSGQNLGTVLGFIASKAPIGAIFVEGGRLTFDRDDQRLFALQEIQSKITLASAGSDAKVLSGISPEQHFRMTGTAQGVIMETNRFPKAVRFTVNQFEVLPLKISISDARIQILDSSFSASGSLDDYLTIPNAGLILNGTIGPEMMQWIRTMASLPPEMTLHTPVNISQARLSWSRSGTTRLEGSASLQNDLNLLYDVSWGAERFVVKNLHISDPSSQASLSLDLEKKVMNLAFSGNLTQAMLKRLFEHERFRFGWIRGNIRTRVALDRPMESTIHGSLEGENLVLPIQMETSVILNRVSLKAVDRTVTLKPVVFSVGDKQHTVTGKIMASANRWLMDLTFDGLEWELLQPLFSDDTTRNKPTPAEKAEKGAPVQATIRLSSGYFSTGRWKASPVRAEISSGEDGLRISLQEAVVCGVNLPGTATFKSTEISLDLKPNASRQDLQSSLFCLAGEQNRITGSFDLSGTVRARGTAQTLFDSLQGTVVMTAKDGRVFQNSIVVRILTYLSVTDLLRGNYTHPGKDGVPYKSIAVRATLQKGIFSLNEAVLTSPLAHLTGRGSFNLPDQTIDLTVLAAPFTTADTVVKKIPLVRDILGDSLVTIPIRVSGPIQNPKIESIPASAVADGLIGIMDRTLGLPYKIIEPIIPGRKNP